MRTVPQLLAVGIGVLVFAGAPARSLSQQPNATPNVRSFVQVIRLRPEMVNEWIALQRDEVIPAQKKAGVKSRTTLVTQVGNAFEYTILTPFPSWAGFDDPAPLVRALGADGAAQLNAKLRRSILTQSSYMTNRVDSLSIPASDALVWRIATRRALPGKVQDYIAYYRADVLPGLRKAKADGKIAGATIAVRGVGAPSGEIATVTYYSKFADIDAGDPLVLALGRQAADAINAKSAQFATATQVVIRRRLPNLSF